MHHHLDGIWTVSAVAGIHHGWGLDDTEGDVDILGITPVDVVYDLHFCISSGRAKHHPLEMTSGKARIIQHENFGRRVSCGAQHWCFVDWSQTDSHLDCHSKVELDFNGKLQEGAVTKRSTFHRVALVATVMKTEVVKNRQVDPKRYSELAPH